ncbi:exopolysaccharide biosynthesis polyprenyl glycosylphosphotransferase [Fictibacillus halophilus]|uniref:exopolysaccharide biosynthesis polyprenyl glycosylphosphotransferase n=1 Tax=Fictibacillus halophilus TaxID=1610490 RepID=UPI0036297247
MNLGNMEKNYFREHAVALESYTTDKIKYFMALKRVIDIVLSSIGIVLMFPILFLIAILIKIESPGPAIYTQERVGYRGRYFKVIKLRSMTVDAELNGAQWAKKNDPRVTKVGLFIRKTRIDELPQLINVLLGEMSLIGPRPERAIFTYQFNEEIPGFINRLQVKPGITGWAQVNGGYDINAKEKLELDQFYIKNLSFWLEIEIFIKTVRVCITGNGAR